MDTKDIKRKFKEVFRIGSEPDFLILGAQKAGTTSLFQYLSLYGENFCPPLKKEIQYFTNNFDCSIHYYRSFFPCKIGRDCKTGEASPTYLYYEKVPERLKSCQFSKMKFVVILRDPVDRAYSHYCFLNYTDKAHGYDPLNFYDAVIAEKKRIDIEKPEFTTNKQIYSYKTRGLYYQQLVNWFRFFDRSDFYILELKDFEKNIYSHLKQLFNFLGIRPVRSLENVKFRHFNKNVYPEMPKNAEEYLIEYFKEPNEKLFDLLGCRYDWKC